MFRQLGACADLLASASYLTGTFGDAELSGFPEAAAALPTADPVTHDLYLLSSQSSNSLTEVTYNL